MRTLDSVACGDDYTLTAQILDVFNSNGGYFVVSGADAFMQLQYGGKGTSFFTNEVHVPVGNGILQPLTQGIRFRNYTAGSTATVSAGLSENAEPNIILTAGGQATPTPVATVNVQHNSVLVGTEPTLDLIDGAGFTFTVVDDGPNTRIQVTPAGYSGRVLGYAEITANVTISAASEATADVIVTAPAVTFNGTTAAMVEFYGGDCRTFADAAADVEFFLYMDGATLGRLGVLQSAGTAGVISPVALSRRVVPAAGAHTFSMRADQSGGNGIIRAGVGGAGNNLPVFIRVVQA